MRYQCETEHLHETTQAVFPTHLSEPATALQYAHAEWRVRLRPCVLAYRRSCSFLHLDKLAAVRAAENSLSEYPEPDRAEPTVFMLALVE